VSQESEKKRVQGNPTALLSVGFPEVLKEMMGVKEDEEAMSATTKCNTTQIQGEQARGIHISIHKCIYIYIYKSIYIHIYIFLYLRLYICISVDMYIHVYIQMYICIDAYIHVYDIHTHTHTHTFDTCACTMSPTHHIILSGGGNVNPNRLGYEY